MLISYLDEDDDAQDTAKYVEEAGRKAVLVRRRRLRAAALPETSWTAPSRSSAGRHPGEQRGVPDEPEIAGGDPDEEWGYTFATNVSAMFHLCKAAVPHMRPGSSIIGSSSVNSDMPSPTLAPYAATKAAIANFSPAWPSCSAKGHPGRTASRPARSGRR